MDSKCAHHNDGVTAQEAVPATAAAENVSSPAASRLASAPALAAPVHLNHDSSVRADRRVVTSRRGQPFNGMFSEITQGENFAVGYSLRQGDLDCMAVRSHGDGLDVIFSVHGSAAGTRHAKLIVRHEGSGGQAPIIRLFLVDLSERAYEWVHDFVRQVTERMHGDTRDQMYNAVSAFCSAVCSKCVSSPLINSDAFYLGTNFHPTGVTGQSTSITGVTVSEDAVDEYPQWSKLPLDCCCWIIDRLDAFSILNFPLVCEPWAVAYAENRRLQPGAPTLLTSPSIGGWDDPDESLRGIFFVQNIILSRETFTAEVDGFKYWRWIGGKDEWLVTTLGSVKLLNPVTGAWTRSLPHHDDITRSYYRVQLCRTPNEAGGYFVIFISRRWLAYTTAESDQWFMLENPNYGREYWRYSDAILHKGKVVAICSNGDLWSWDLDEQGAHPTQLLRSTIDSEGWQAYDFLLAPSLNDNLLIVSPYGEYISDRDAGNRCTSFRNGWNLFTVYGAVLREVHTDAKWIEDVHDIGDRALFLGPNYPFYVPVSAPSGDLKRNHVYIADITYSEAVAINLREESIPDKATKLDYNGPVSNPYQVPMWFRPAFP